MMLKGIKVLDLTRLLPGPYSSLMLADYGAEVIKVEDTGLGDYMREVGPHYGKVGARYYCLNRNKKSISINLKTEEGKEVFRRLVKDADVVLESFRPGVMDKLGLGYEDLKEVNPSIIYCAITGFGQDGPYKDKPGHDLNYIGYSGILGLNRKKGQKPTLPPVQIADLAGGALMATTSILMAIIHKLQTNEGQKLDISMLDGTISLMYILFPSMFMGDTPKVEGERLTGGLACYNVYETKDAKFVAVGALEKKFWVPFCEVMNLGEDWIENHTNEEKQPAMMEELQATFLTKTQAEWTERLNEKDTCCTPVLDIEDVPENEQVKARKMFFETINEHGEKITQLRPPIVSSVQQLELTEEAPLNGQHTESILYSLGYSHEQVSELKESKVIKFNSVNRV